MIFRNDYRLQGFMDRKLDHIEQMQIQKKQNVLLPYPDVQPDEMIPHHIPKSTYQDNYEMNYENQEPAQADMMENELLLNKFKSLMQHAVEDNSSQTQFEKNSTTSIKSGYCRNKDKNFDALSSYSVTESKFGDLLLSNPSLKLNDIKRLIKDNFAYFKHLFGYCICIKCPCGFCKCEYMKKDQKKIKFRGGFQKEKGDNLQYFNKNLNRHQTQQSLANMYDNPDKINNIDQKNSQNMNYATQREINKYEAPMLSLTTNQLNYQQYAYQARENNYKPRDQIQKDKSYKDQNQTMYNEQFVHRKQNKIDKCHIPNNIKFPTLPMQKSSYSNDFKTPDNAFPNPLKYKDHRSSLINNASKAVPVQSTNAQTYKGEKIQYCVEEDPKYLIKRDMLRKIEQMMENKNMQQEEI